MVDKPQEYSKLVRESTIIIDQFGELSQERIKQFITNAKDKCFKDTNNANDFVACSQVVIKSIDENTLIAKIKHIYFDIKLQRCMQKDDENQIYSCLGKLRRTVKKELNFLEKNWDNIKNLK